MWIRRIIYFCFPKLLIWIRKKYCLIRINCYTWTNEHMNTPSWTSKHACCWWHSSNIKATPKLQGMCYLMYFSSSVMAWKQCAFCCLPWFHMILHIVFIPYSTSTIHSLSMFEVLLYIWCCCSLCYHKYWSWIWLLWWFVLFSCIRIIRW